MGFNISGLLKKLRAPITSTLVVYGNMGSCIVEFKGDIRAYQNLHDAEQVIKDFGLFGKEIIVKTGRREYQGHEYLPLKHIQLSDFGNWLKRKGVRVGYRSPF